MNIAKSALALALSAYPTARAFSSPTITRAVSSARVSSSTTQQLRNNIMSSANRSSSSTSLKANVLKLSEPAKDLLPGVDVFIFDCDGVIWRVSNIICLVILYCLLLLGSDMHIHMCCYVYNVLTICYS